MESFKKHLQQFPHFSQSAYEIALPHLKEVQIQADEYFLEQGKICKNIAFIESGLFRLYYLNDGKEITTCFCKENTLTCSYRSLINKYRDLLIDRPQSFQHGDYHIGNMIITEKGELGVIDFNRLDFGDPWEEFNRIPWCASMSKWFASGRINGYFAGEVPTLFFKLMGLYISSNQLGAIHWAVAYGESEVETILAQTQEVLEWYDNFEMEKPNWYLSES